MVMGPTPPGTGVSARDALTQRREFDIADAAGVVACVHHDRAFLDPLRANELRSDPLHPRR